MHGRLIKESQPSDMIFGYLLSEYDIICPGVQRFCTSKVIRGRVSEAFVFGALYGPRAFHIGDKYRLIVLAWFRFRFAVRGLEWLISHTICIACTKNEYTESVR